MTADGADVPALCPGLTTARRRSLAGLTISDARAPAGWLSPRHQHPEATIIAVLAGRLGSATADDELEWTPGSVRFQPRGDCPAVRGGTVEARLLVVGLSDFWLSRMPHPESATRAREVQHLFVPAVRLYRELLSWTRTSPLMAEGIVLEMLGVLSRAGSHHRRRTEPRWLTVAEAYVRRNLRRRVSLEDVAAETGVNPAHLSRTWHYFRGVSMSEWIRQARIEEACCRIAAGGAVLADLAREIGFADQTHFTRAFKQVTGMTPGELRGVLAMPPLHGTGAQ